MTTPMVVVRSLLGLWFPMVAPANNFQLCPLDSHGLLLGTLLKSPQGPGGTGETRGERQKELEESDSKRQRQKQR